MDESSGEARLRRADPVPFPQGPAVCQEVDPELFFPPASGRDGTGPAARRQQAEAIAVCRRCPLVEPCLRYAIAHDVDGVWGATSQQERRAMRKQMGIAPIPVHLPGDWTVRPPGRR